MQFQQVQGFVAPQIQGFMGYNQWGMPLVAVQGGAPRQATAEEQLDQLNGVTHTCPRERSVPFVRKYMLGGEKDKRPTFYGEEDSSILKRACCGARYHPFNVTLKNYNDDPLMTIERPSGEWCNPGGAATLMVGGCVTRACGSTCCNSCWKLEMTVKNAKSQQLGTISMEPKTFPLCNPMEKEFPYVVVKDAQGNSLYEMRNVGTKCNCDVCKVSCNNCCVALKRCCTCAECRREKFELHFPVNGGKGEGSADDVMTEVVATGEHCCAFVAPDSEWSIKFPTKARTHRDHKQHKMLLAALPVFIQHHGPRMLHLQGFSIPNTEKPDDKIYFANKKYTYSCSD